MPDNIIIYRHLASEGPSLALPHLPLGWLPVYHSMANFNANMIVSNTTSSDNFNANFSTTPWIMQWQPFSGKENGEQEGRQRRRVLASKHKFGLLKRGSRRGRCTWTTVAPTTHSTWHIMFVCTGCCSSEALYPSKTCTLERRHGWEPIHKDCHPDDGTNEALTTKSNW
jgi:hypothetical protein